MYTLLPHMPTLLMMSQTQTPCQSVAELTAVFSWLSKVDLKQTRPEINCEKKLLWVCFLFFSQRLIFNKQGQKSTEKAAVSLFCSLFFCFLQGPWSFGPFLSSGSFEPNVFTCQGCVSGLQGCQRDLRRTGWSAGRRPLRQEVLTLRCQNERSRAFALCPDWSAGIPLH